MMLAQIKLFSLPTKLATSLKIIMLLMISIFILLQVMFSLSILLQVKISISIILNVIISISILLPLPTMDLCTILIMFMDNFILLLSPIMDKLTTLHLPHYNNIMVLITILIIIILLIQDNTSPNQTTTTRTLSNSTIIIVTTFMLVPHHPMDNKQANQSKDLLLMLRTHSLLRNQDLMTKHLSIFKFVVWISRLLIPKSCFIFWIMSYASNTNCLM